MKKKYIIIVSIIIFILFIGSILLFIFMNDKENIMVNELEILSVLDSANSSKAATQTKENIVKITNKINDKNIIYGTGFFDKSGYLVTNSHVVDIKGDITITYSNGNSSKATLVSNNILSDIAILSVKDIKVKALPFASTLNLLITDELYSIGHQLNLEGDATVTKGILSAKRVSSGIEFLQTDAAVNKGGSGGPVINSFGEVLGMIALATDNATLSFAISSDTLQLYIDKLIDNKEITYVTDKRDVNALNSVLVEVNYKSDDIYEENNLLINSNKDKDKDKDNKNKLPNKPEKPNKNDKPSNNQQEIEKPKEIFIEPNGSTAPVLVNTELDTEIIKHFSYGKDLTGCKLDFSGVNMAVPGIYEIKLICNENTGSKKIEVYGPIEPNHIDIPKIVLDETKTNVTSFSEIEGTWYFPGYKDACEIFSYERGYYEWFSMSIDPWKGKLSYKYGGGTRYENESEFLNHVKFWRDGNFLVITTSSNQYTLTSIRGKGVFDERHYFDDMNLCK